MISSRWTGANALAVRIRPRFEGTREGTDSALDLAGIAQANRAQLDTDRRPHGFQSAQLSGARGYRRISKDCNALEVRRDLPQQLEPFPADAVLDNRDPDRIAHRARHALDQPTTV